jgi:MYXO-CTERM domain-containing protein
MRTSLFFAGAAALALLARPTPAYACGGCFHDPNETPTVVTDHRMILSVSMNQTTLYDQIHYSGSPGSFAWVLPINGTVDVGLSADLVFGTLDTLTRTTVYQPPLNCPAPPYCDNAPSFGGAADAGVAYDAGSVNIIKQEVVGPYETVQLSSSDPAALSNWLTSHGYAIPTDIQPIIDAYVTEGFGFLALKLVPGASVQAMRPVRVTTLGASPVLPLRMVAAGTGSSVGITLWVIGEGRYEPQNFPWFRIDDSEIVWDYSTASSNFSQLRQLYEQQSGNRAWEVESSLPLYPSNFTQLVDNGGTNFPYYGYDAGSDYSSVTTADGGAESPEQVRADDLATLFAGMNPSDIRVTRIRADLARASLAQDLTLQASADQTDLSNLRYPTKSINAPQCQTYPPCPGGNGGISTYGGGCAVSPEGDGGGMAFTLAGFLALGVHTLARRRKR